MKKIALFSFLLLIQELVFAQTDFATLVRYDNLRVSPKRDMIAFRMILCEEAHPETAKLFLFLISSNHFIPVCLNPPIERIAVSPNKQFLMFTSPFGLYLMKLSKSQQPHLILTRKLTDKWQFGDLGFSKSGKSIFAELKHENEGKSYFQIFDLPASLPEAKFPEFLPLASTKAVSFDSTFKSPVVFSGNSAVREIITGNFSLKFIADESTDFSGDYFLIFSNKKNKIRLLEKCRPRIFSANPDSSLFLLSVFRENQNQLYLFDVEKQKLTLIKNSFVIAALWLNSDRFLTLEEKDLFLFDIKRKRSILLNDWQPPEWCHDIPLQQPGFTLKISISDQIEKEKFFHLINQTKNVHLLKYEHENSFDLYFGEFPIKSTAQTMLENSMFTQFNCSIEPVEYPFDFYNLMGKGEFIKFFNGVAKIQNFKNRYLKSRIIYFDENSRFLVLMPFLTQE